MGLVQQHRSASAASAAKARGCWLKPDVLTTPIPGPPLRGVIETASAEEGKICRNLKKCTISVLRTTLHARRASLLGPGIPISLGRTLLASAAAAISVAVATPAALANGLSFTNYTTTNGLGSNEVKGVYASGNNIYAATGGGLSIYDGTSWTTKTTNNGLGHNSLNGVYASGINIYVATQDGISISNNSGSSFTNYTNNIGNYVNYVYASGLNVYAAMSGAGVGISTNGGTNWNYKTTTNSLGLGSDLVYGVYASDNAGVTSIYAATYNGLSISTNGGANWNNKLTSNGLGSNSLNGVYVSGLNVYAATQGGLSISTDGGNNFTNYTNSSTGGGLGNNNVRGVYASGGNVYAATDGGGVSIYDGTTWSTYTTANGLSRYVNGVYVSGTSIYAATSPDITYDEPPNFPNCFFDSPPCNFTETVVSEGGLSIAQQSDPNPVPAPLPVLGSAAALGFCRRLRSRSKRLRHAATPRLA